MPLILGTNSIKDTGYDVANSLRFNDGSSDYLNRTQSTSPTNSKKGTISFGLKRSALGDQHILNGYTDTNNRAFLNFTSNNRLQVGQKNSGTTVYQIEETAQRRDVSAWYNCVFAFDTTDATASNRIKLYVNGSQVTDFTTNNEIEVNEDIKLFNLANLQLGRAGGGSNYFDGYLAEFVYVDGSQLGADSFGEFDSDSPTIWKPKDVSGLTFGTNGFYLDFEDSSALGNDAAGSNNFTANNLTATDQSTDTCTNNFATLNPLQHALGATVPALSEGNLRIANTINDKAQTQYSNFAVSSGKWYCEIKMTSGSVFRPGISTLNSQQAEGQSGENQNFPGQWSEGWGYYYANGVIYNGGSSIATYSTFAAGDIISIAVDMDNEKLYFGKNGTWQNSANPATNSNGIDISGIASNSNVVFGLQVEASSGGGTYGDFNFGSPSFSISSSNTDGNGYGNFEYSVPSGYYSLNTKNLAEFG